jgi:hypothetical protein
MEKRIISVVLSGDLHKKLRTLQGKMIKDSKENISFSQVINDVLMRGLDNNPK